ncbi:unnamed protein product [Rotaria socialis]|uniref:Caspase family p20 domain-containing protein n=1 Tax=Rotaria socialis TaxID=392032 RepID=A0A818JVX2_9BILA|nr:unnamed protein product [Rotaria socialis]CAF3513800.1 unnamed protein product [Rotaria socialis]CAF3546190.1 unnamed protein product [Rotaria socialis]
MCSSYSTPAASDYQLVNQRKRALVIGVSQYEDGSNLSNPRNDANDMANALEKIGFMVMKGINLKSDEMDANISSFVQSIQGTDMALFYFAGHGCQWEDQNFLIPSDNTNLSGPNIKRRAINAQHVLEQITKRNPYVAIFLLDCCRNYHLRHPQLSRGEQNRGLTAMYASSGSLVAFACAPGQTASDGSGKNGLFTKHLLQHITTPNEDIQMLLRDVSDGVEQESSGQQIPYQNSSLRRRNIYINAADSGKISFTEVKQNSLQRQPSNM